MPYDSPLRYPGGKASLATFLARTIELNNLSGCSYLEPFAGGAGAALRLLREGVASELYLNDLDPHIVSFWRAVLNEPERFADAVRTVPMSVAEWRKQEEVSRRADLGRSFELGFATFYLNRCNRSGIILGAAPIGGYAQAGKWRMDARFYRESLAERILAIGRRREQIHVTNMDALEFLAKHFPGGHGHNSAFVYLDPPYYANGNRLYMNYYCDREHRKLARYMQTLDGLKWVMSYDDTDYIRRLYAACEVSIFYLQYSVQRRRKAQELLISPPQVQLPDFPPAMGERDRGQEPAQARTAK